MTDSHQRRHSPRLWILLSGLIAAASLSVFGQARLPAPGPASRADFAPKPPITAKTAEEQAKTFVLPPGYRMELVLADPEIDTPAVVEFDGNGRMYVAEFITYMPDVEGTGQREPKSRISRWEDTNGDGTYDKHTVFADKLVLPRMVLPLDNDSILTNETASDDVIKLTDTNGDGVADKREVFYSGVGIGRDGNLEHEQSGFVWGLDNWIYSTYNSFRFRWTPTGHRPRADRLEQRPVGARAGRRREDVVRVRGMRARTGELPGADPLRRVQDRRRVRAGLRQRVADLRLADVQGGMFRVRMPDRHGESRDRDRRAGHRPRPSRP